MESDQLIEHLQKILFGLIEDLSLLRLARESIENHQSTSWAESRVQERKLMIAEIDALLQDTDPGYDNSKTMYVIAQHELPTNRTEWTGSAQALTESKMKVSKILSSYNFLLEYNGVLTHLNHVLRQHKEGLDDYLAGVEYQVRLLAS